MRFTKVDKNNPPAPLAAAAFFAYIRDNSDAIRWAAYGENGERFTRALNRGWAVYVIGDTDKDLHDWARDGDAIVATEKAHPAERIFNHADHYPLATNYSGILCAYESRKAQVGAAAAPQYLLATAHEWVAAKLFRGVIFATSLAYAHRMEADIGRLLSHRARGLPPGHPSAGEEPTDPLHILHEQAMAAAGRFIVRNGDKFALHSDYADLSAMEGGVSVMLRNIATGNPVYSPTDTAEQFLAKYHSRRLPSVQVFVDGDASGLAHPAYRLRVRLVLANVDASGVTYQWHTCIGSQNLRGANLVGGDGVEYVVRNEDIGANICVEVGGLLATDDNSAIPPMLGEVVRVAAVIPPARSEGNTSPTSPPPADNG